MSTYSQARRPSPGWGGASVAPPPPPPSPPARRRRGPRDPLWARLLVVFGALMMLASGGTIVGGKVVINRVTSGVTQEDLIGDAGAGAGSGENVIEGPLNILMLGIDERQDSPDEATRADSIIILHVNAAHDQAFIISIPRDLEVDIPPYPKTKFRGSREKINAAFFYGSQDGGGRAGGFELLALTVKQLTGMRFINAGAIVDFKGFGAVVGALGGVDMCVDTPEPVVSEHVGFDKNGKYLHPRDGGKPAVYPPGCHHFAPWQALDYVRQRKGPGLPNGDYDRQRHQQQFIKAMIKEAKEQGVASNPVKAYKVISAAGKALTVDTGGASLEDWMFTLRNVTDKDLVMLKTNAGKLNSVWCGNAACERLTPDSEAMLAALRTDTLAEFVADHPDFVNTVG